MSHYEYSSHSLPSNSTGIGGFDASKAVFNQVDINQDGTIDRSEFQQWAVGGTGTAGKIIASGSRELMGGFESSSFRASNCSSVEGLGGLFGVDGAQVGSLNNTSFESSSLASFDGVDTGSAIQALSTESTTTGTSFDATAVNQAASYTAETNAAWSKYGAEVKGIGLYVDANPQVIRRAAPDSVQVYTQNIKIRFLQPPPIIASGPLIIKEVRPPQPPPPPPLCIKQQAPPLPQPPPLILRERPPPLPPSQAAQTVIRTLPPLPPPPRSVIIERVPANPAPPRDIIIERWLPYGPLPQRKTIVQRAGAAEAYHKPRNIIIQYEPVQVRIVRQFQRLNVTQENPQAYIQRYGPQLLDTQTLLNQARAAGVVEDISPPAGTSATFSQEASLINGSTNGVKLVGLVSGESGGASTSFSTSTFEGSHTNSAGFTGTGFDSGLVEGIGIASEHGSSGFGSSSYPLDTMQGTGGFDVETNFAAGLGGNYQASSHESTGFASRGNSISSASGLDVAAAAFYSADKNKDGTVDANEFKQFFYGGI